jgi:hypothetical protein
MWCVLTVSVVPIITNFSWSLGDSNCVYFKASNRSSYPASFSNRWSMSLSYRESKWPEALITQVFFLFFPMKSLHWTFLNLFLIFSLSLDAALNQFITFSLVLFVVRVRPPRNTNSVWPLRNTNSVRPLRNSNSVSSGVSNHRMYP